MQSLVLNVSLSEIVSLSRSRPEKLVCQLFEGQNSLYPPQFLVEHLKPFCSMQFFLNKKAWYCSDSGQLEAGSVRGTDFLWQGRHGGSPLRLGANCHLREAGEQWAFCVGRRLHRRGERRTNVQIQKGGKARFWEMVTPWKSLEYVIKELSLNFVLRK